MDDKSDVKPGATEGSVPPTRAPYAGGGGAEAGHGRRFSARRKLAAVQRLMRGESLEALSRELGVMDAAALSLCKENDIPIMVLNLDTPSAVVKAVRGDQIGTLVHR